MQIGKILWVCKLMTIQVQLVFLFKDISFYIGATTVDPQSHGYDPRPLIAYLAALGVPYFYEEQSAVCLRVLLLNAKYFLIVLALLISRLHLRIENACPAVSHANACHHHPLDAYDNARTRSSGIVHGNVNVLPHLALVKMANPCLSRLIV